MSSSILTNTSAMNSVASLAATQSQLAATQSQISTGLKVSSASDNASYWSIATSMRSDVGALSSVSDSLNLGVSVVSTALQAVSSSIGVLSQMKDLVVSAQTAGQDTSTIDTQLQQLQTQLRTFSNSASFNGVNLLTATTGDATTNTFNVVTSFSRSVSGTTSTDSVGVTDISLTQALYSSNADQGATSYTGAGVLDKVNTSTGYSIDNLVTSSTTSSGSDTTTATLLTDEQNQIEAAISALTTAAGILGSTESNLTAQGTFTQTLSNSLTSGVGSLVDADMNQASTRLNALQTQQQLGIQSLSIANQNSQMILKLFGL
ncbi:MAG: flagellin [Beijerinckiaceae bacterium]